MRRALTGVALVISMLLTTAACEPVEPPSSDAGNPDHGAPNRPKPKQDPVAGPPQQTCTAIPPLDKNPGLILESAAPPGRIRLQAWWRCTSVTIRWYGTGMSGVQSGVFTVVPFSFIAPDDGLATISVTPFPNGLQAYHMCIIYRGKKVVAFSQRPDSQSAFCTAAPP